MTIIGIILKISLFFTLNTSFELDLNKDLVLERGEIKDGIFSIYSGDQKIFEENKDYKISEVLVGDILGDNKEEILVFLWKKGNYGNSKPFWINENDDSYKMHLFVYKLENASPLQISPIWQSSNLPFENVKNWLYDIDGDKKLELTTLQKTYNSNKLSFGIWDWNGWGFEKISK